MIFSLSGNMAKPQFMSVNAHTLAHTHLHTFKYVYVEVCTYVQKYFNFHFLAFRKFEYKYILVKNQMYFCFKAYTFSSFILIHLLLISMSSPAINTLIIHLTLFLFSAILCFGNKCHGAIRSLVMLNKQWKELQQESQQLLSVKWDWYTIQHWIETKTRRQRPYISQIFDKFIYFHKILYRDV